MGYRANPWASSGQAFGWLHCYRRLSKDYEMHVENSESTIYGSLIRLMIRRLAS
jgi:putative transposase